MELKKRVEQLLARIAAMQIPIYAGNASFSCCCPYSQS